MFFLIGNIMKIENRKFISANNGLVYSVPKTRWKKHLKLIVILNCVCAVLYYFGAYFPPAVDLSSGKK